MDDRFNTAAGWVLFSGIIALGLSIISGMFFDTHRPEAMGYPIEVADAEGGADAGPDLGTLLASADVAAGESEAAGRCGTCHTFNQGGAAGTGPNLYGVLGKGFASNPGFANYSGDLKGAGGTWDWETMNRWILNPKGLVPGTTMGFAGLKNDQARANILAYLNSLGSNLPLPEPVVAEEADEGDAAEGEEATEGEAEATEGEAEAADGEADASEETAEAEEAAAE
ncbi:c-type cytochrome [Pontixanthobacter aquaemixtae]|uniref:C-type cytochrome n=1 Tax=Pontixanthobacter aquaemixtae TaxID=1958940 RepID=A0A844ZXZ4_9SPHN|nr:c-type cytochrome [Pontixanthobacter aquaemixtae]MXO91806.1 c-type cytochrome [Pontixanthobacter aquaemixtae]